MNSKLFDQLIEAATVQNYSSHCGGTYTVEVDHHRLVELVVQECIKASMKSVGPDAEYEAWYLIKQHFGVE